MEDLFARKDDSGRKQKLSEHLKHTADLAANFSITASVSRLSGLLHDMGKAARRFQTYLERGGEKGSVPHAPQGAFFAREFPCGTENDAPAIVLKEILSVIIYSHHNSLADLVPPRGEDPFFDRLENKNEERFSYDEVKTKFDTACGEDVKKLFFEAKEEMQGVLDKIASVYANNRRSRYFALGLLVKYLYSCLIDADRLDAYAFDIDGAGGEGSFEKFLGGDEKKFDIDKNEESLDEGGEGFDIGESEERLEGEGFGIGESEGKLDGEGFGIGESEERLNGEGDGFDIGESEEKLDGKGFDIGKNEEKLEREGFCIGENEERLDGKGFGIGESEKGCRRWDGAIRIFEKNLRRLREKNLKDYGGERDIDKIRAKISEQCKNAAEKPTGIYRLSVPTGGGKTLSSLRFALFHAKKYGKKRIVYVIPYLSIIEQTAHNLREIFGLDEKSDFIFEHHSNIVPPKDDDEETVRRFAEARWDNPIVITTMVRFLETVMSSRGGELRKLHNMSDAVIIFDEIQALPVNSIHLFNETVSFLCKMLGATVLLCSATQPPLSATIRTNLLLAEKPDLIDGAEEDFARIKRVNIIAEKEKDADGLVGFAAEKAENEDNCLVIVNTKKTAREVFEKLKTRKLEGVQLYHLSTAMCAAHRFGVLDKIKKDLKSKRKIVCVSTQLIEAGVDISFSCVVRASAGLDSVAQAAGRCNRNGESKILKNVYAVPLKGENLDKLRDIKLGKETAERVMRENPNADYASGEMLKIFYDYYFPQRENEMDYNVREGGSVYAMLADNRFGRENYKNKKGKGKEYRGCLSQAFASAADAFKVISNDTEAVVVPYGESVKLIEEYKKTYRVKEKIAIIRKLEKFSVQLHRGGKLARLEEMGAVSVLDGEFGIRILNENYYKEECGVSEEIEPESLIL